MDSYLRAVSAFELEDEQTLIGQVKTLGRFKWSRGPSYGRRYLEKAFHRRFPKLIVVLLRQEAKHEYLLFLILQSQWREGIDALLTFNPGYPIVSHHSLPLSTLRWLFEFYEPPLYHTFSLCSILISYQSNLPTLVFVFEKFPYLKDHIDKIVRGQMILWSFVSFFMECGWRPSRAHKVFHLQSRVEKTFLERMFEGCDVKDYVLECGHALLEMLDPRVSRPLDSLDLQRLQFFLEVDPDLPNRSIRALSFGLPHHREILLQNPSEVYPEDLCRGNKDFEKLLKRTE